MRLSKIHIENFRNFKLLDISLGDHAVIVGENKIGKSNLLYALRLVLDPSLPDSARQLREEDFWDGISRPLKKEDSISISVEFTDFENSTNELAVLAEHLVGVAPMTARLTYIFRPIPGLEGAPGKSADYEFFVFGGERADNVVGYELRKRLSMDILPALRDAEGDLANWRRSPLHPLLEEAAAKVDPADLKEIAEKVSDASDAITAVPEIKALDDSVTNRLKDMVGTSHAVDVMLGLTPTDPDRLIRALRPFIDKGMRGITEASLGSANLIYLALKSLEFQQLVAQGNRDHTFLAIEEPEAHLHPHLQRLIYRDYLRPRTVGAEAAEQLGSNLPNTTILLTTHSPHIVSVSPLRSLVLLHRASDGQSAMGHSTAALELDNKDVADLERYLDVTRGEIVFSRGVLLVEGDAELFLVPALSRLNGYDLDELGISVCSVSGTNFTPYVKFLGANGLNIPFAVMTDYDPTEKSSFGVSRIKLLLGEVLQHEPDVKTEEQLLTLARDNGLFLNEHTLEIDLFRAGRHKSMCKTIGELTDNGAAKKRAQNWLDHPNQLDAEQLLKDIEAVGKGRFAQRLATRIKGTSCPSYILDAVKYVAKKCK